MSIFSAFAAAVGKAKPTTASDAPARTRPGSDGAPVIGGDDHMRVPGVSIPVAMSAHFNMSTGYEDPRTSKDEDVTFPSYEPDDENILYRLFRIRV